MTTPINPKLPALIPCVCVTHYKKVSRPELRCSACGGYLGEAIRDDGKGTTHAEGCHAWGRRHYACAEAKIEALELEIAVVFGNQYAGASMTLKAGDSRRLTPEERTILNDCFMKKLNDRKSK